MADITRDLQGRKRYGRSEPPPQPAPSVKPAVQARPADGDATDTYAKIMQGPAGDMSRTNNPFLKR